MTEQPKDVVLSNNDMHPAEEIAHLKDLLGKANALARIRAERIKELEAAQPADVEPVAWVDPKHLEWLSQSPDNQCGAGLASRKRFADMVPLYTHPPARVPLTDKQINALELPPSGTATVRDLVRLIEQAHGIGGGK